MKLLQYLPLIMLFTLIPRLAYANCEPFIVGERLVKQTDLIFKGVVLENFDNLNPEGKRGEFSHKTKFMIVDRYKGFKFNSVDIYYHGFQGIIPTVYAPEIGKTYFVYAEKNKKGQFFIHACQQGYISYEMIINHKANRSTFRTLDAMVRYYPRFFPDKELMSFLKSRRWQGTWEEKLFYFFTTLF